MQHSAFPSQIIAHQWWHCWNTWNGGAAKKPSPISESGGSDGWCLSVFICWLCLQLLFFPPGHRNINFQLSAAASFPHLAGHSVHHGDWFRQGSGRARRSSACFGGQSPNRQFQARYNEPMELQQPSLKKWKTLVCDFSIRSTLNFFPIWDRVFLFFCFF